MDEKKFISEYFKYTGGGQKEKVIAGPTADALQSFCRQESEFYERVKNSEKSFNDCIQSIVMGIGNAVSDLEVFEKAVKFYFPGAGIKFSMEINTCADIEKEFGTPEEETAKIEVKHNDDFKPELKEKKKITLDLDDLLDF